MAFTPAYPGQIQQPALSDPSAADWQAWFTSPGTNPLTNAFVHDTGQQVWNTEAATPSAFSDPQYIGAAQAFNLPLKPGSAGTQAGWANYYAQGQVAGYTPTGLGIDPAATYQGEFANPSETNQAQFLGFNQAYGDPASQADWAKIFSAPSLSGITQTEYNNLYGNLNPTDFTQSNPLESAYESRYAPEIATAKGVQPGFNSAENAANASEQGAYNFALGAYQGGAGVASQTGLPGPTAPMTAPSGFPAFDPWNATLDPSYLANTQTGINADVADYGNYTNNYGGYINSYIPATEQQAAQNAAPIKHGHKPTTVGNSGMSQAAWNAYVASRSPAEINPVSGQPYVLPNGQPFSGAYTAQQQADRAAAWARAAAAFNNPQPQQQALGPHGTTGPGSLSASGGPPAGAQSPYGGHLPQAVLNALGPSALASEVAAGAATSGMAGIANQAQAGQVAAHLAQLNQQAVQQQDIANAIGGYWRGKYGGGHTFPGLGEGQYGAGLTGPGLGVGWGVGNPAGTPGIGNIETTPDYLRSYPGSGFPTSDWTSASSGAASVGAQNQLFPSLASGGGGPQDSAASNITDSAFGGPPDTAAFSGMAAWGGQPPFTPSGDANFSDPLSGLQMPPVDTSQDTPSWMAPLGAAFEHFFNPSQQPAEIFQGGLPATADFQPTFANMEQAFQGGLPASPGPPETSPAVPDYQGGLPATPGPQAPLSGTEQIIQDLKAQQEASTFQGGLPAAPPQSTFAATDLGSFLSALRGGEADISSTFQGGLPPVPASPEGVAGAAVQADPLGMMGGLPAIPLPAGQGFGGGSRTQEASQVPQPPGVTTLNPDLPPEVQAAGMLGGMFPNISWPAFEASARPSQNIEDARSFAIPAAEPDSASFIWPDASNPNRDILGSSPLTTMAPSDAGLPSGSPGLTPDVVSPTVPFGIQPTAQAPDFGGLPVEPNQAAAPPDFGGPTPPVDQLQGQGFGGGSKTEEPQGWPNFTPKPEPMETWTIPQSKADLLVQKYGQTPTLRQIVVGENGSEPFGFSLLGSGVDTPIDLSKPIEPQLTAALGSMAGQAVPLIMGKMAGAGMSAADIQGAARGAANPNYFPPGSGPGTGPIAGPEALSGPSNFVTLQSGSPWGAEPSAEPHTMPEAPQVASQADFGPAPADAFGGAPQNPQGFGGGSENEQLTQLPLSNPVLAALRKPGMDFLSTPEGQNWARQNIAGVAQSETPAASKESFNLKNLITWFDAQANRGLGKGLDIQQTYENNVPGYGSFWPGAGTIAGTANAHVGTALNPETGLPASYYNNEGTGAAIQRAQIMGALMAAYGGSPYGGLINNSGANYASMDPSKGINMPAPNTINFAPSVYGEGFAASPQQGVYNLVKQYNATANAMFPGAVPVNLSPMEIQSILMNARGNTMAAPQQIMASGGAMGGGELPPGLDLYAQQPPWGALGAIGQNANWGGFNNPSQNVEDVRTGYVPAADPASYDFYLAQLAGLPYNPGQALRYPPGDIPVESQY